VKYAAIGAGAILVVAVGVAAFLSLQSPLRPATSSANATPCTPKPCANVRGYILWVSDLKVDSGLVTMQLTFRNSSAATHADPADIQLVDAKGHGSSAVYDAPGCARWARTDFNNGAQFGPVPECFRPGATDPPLMLHWAPDMGLFCCDLNLALAS
jgi:hypothetical protein